jgi:hypothetical protein
LRLDEGIGKARSVVLTWANPLGGENERNETMKSAGCEFEVADAGRVDETIPMMVMTSKIGVASILNFRLIVCLL